MRENKTKPTAISPDDYVASVGSEQRRSQGQKLLAIMGEVTSTEPRMWGPSMIGFGEYHYKGKSTEGDWFRVGFSPRTSALVLYGLVYYDEAESNNQLLNKLGTFKRGKGCIYVSSLENIDETVLRKMIHDAYFHDNQGEA